MEGMFSSSKYEYIQNCKEELPKYGHILFIIRGVGRSDAYLSKRSDVRCSPATCVRLRHVFLFECDPLITNGHLNVNELLEQASDASNAKH